jgi:hypothetical protein
LDSVPFAGFLKPADVFQSCQGAHFRTSRIVIARFLSFPSGQSEKSSRVTLTRAKARVDRWVVSQEQTSAWAPRLVPPPGRGVCARRLGEAHPRGHSTSPAHESGQPLTAKKRCRRLRAVWSVRDHCRQISVLLPPSGLGRAAWVRKSGLSGCLFGMRVAPGFSGAIAIHFQVIYFTQQDANDI